MKKTLLATTALAFVAAHASAVDVELYGQVNKGLFGYNDGLDSNVVVIDNALSSTRFGMKGAQALDNGLTASVLFEGEMASNPSDSFTQASANGSTGTSTTPGNTSPSFSERQARVGLSGNFGGVYLGQQSTAIDGVLTQDLVGAQDVMTADYARVGGSIKFRNSANTLQSFDVNDLASGIAQSRTDSVRYDSPIFAGFQARASVAQGGDTEGAVFYDGAAGDFKLKGAAGVRMVNSSTTQASNFVERQYAASVSAAHTSGLGATVGYTRNDLDHKTSIADEAEGWYAKVGYAWDAFEVAADYGDNNNFRSAVASSDELTTYGLGAQYNLGNGVSVAGLYRTYDADVTGASTQDIDLYGVNMRVKF
jgi:predicted porin